MSKSNLEQTFETHLKAYKLPVPTKEFAFHPKRRWRFDFAWQDRKVAVEIEGGTFGGKCGICKGRGWRWDSSRRQKAGCPACKGQGERTGRHISGVGFEKDCEKYNEATRLGWKVFRFTGNMVTKGDAICFLLSFFGQVEISKNAF